MRTFHNHAKSWKNKNKNWSFHFFRFKIIKLFQFAYLFIIISWLLYNGAYAYSPSLTVCSGMWPWINRDQPVTKIASTKRFGWPIFIQRSLMEKCYSWHCWAHKWVAISRMRPISAWLNEILKRTSLVHLGGMKRQRRMEFEIQKVPSNSVNKIESENIFHQSTTSRTLPKSLEKYQDACCKL